MAKLELYGTASCPYTQGTREWLEWTRRDFLEYDIEADPEARKRMHTIDSSVRTVPVLVEDGKVIQVGWRGRGCVVGAGALMATACSVRVRGVVQGVGFRPFVYRLAQENMLAGWVLNGDQGVEIHLEGADEDLAAFVEEIQRKSPAAARIAAIEVEPVPCQGLSEFTIRESERLDRPTVCVSPICRSVKSASLSFVIHPISDSAIPTSIAPTAARAIASFIRCPTTGLIQPCERGRWIVIAAMSITTHPIAGSTLSRLRVQIAVRNYFLCDGAAPVSEGREAIDRSAQLLCDGKIVAVKGLGGYHLACDARNPESNKAMRERKFRKREAVCADGERPCKQHAISFGFLPMPKRF